MSYNPIPTLSGDNAIFDGNVGIGTTTPSAKLDVNGTLNIGDDVLINGSINIVSDADKLTTLANLGIFQQIPLGSGTAIGSWVDNGNGTFSATSGAVGNTVTFYDTPTLVAGGLYLLIFELIDYTTGVLGYYFSTGGARQMTAISTLGAGYMGCIGVYNGTFAADIAFRINSTFTGTIGNIKLYKLF